MLDNVQLKNSTYTQISLKISILNVSNNHNRYNPTYPGKPGSMVTLQLGVPVADIRAIQVLKQHELKALVGPS